MVLYEDCHILRLFKEATAKVKNGGTIPPFPMSLHGVVLNSFSTQTNLERLYSVA
jgi:hypothetical protein